MPWANLFTVSVAAVEFAAYSGGRITGYHALDDMYVIHSGAQGAAGPLVEYDRRSREAAEAHLGELGTHARHQYLSQEGRGKGVA